MTPEQASELAKKLDAIAVDMHNLGNMMVVFQVILIVAIAFATATTTSNIGSFTQQLRKDIISVLRDLFSTKE